MAEEAFLMMLFLCCFPEKRAKTGGGLLTVFCK